MLNVGLCNSKGCKMCVHWMNKFSLFVFGIIKIAHCPQDRTRTHVGLLRTLSPVGSFVAFCSSFSVPADVYTVGTNI